MCGGLIREDNSILSDDSGSASDDNTCWKRRARHVSASDGQARTAAVPCTQDGCEAEAAESHPAVEPVPQPTAVRDMSAHVMRQHNDGGEGQEPTVGMEICREVSADAAPDSWTRPPPLQLHAQGGPHSEPLTTPTDVPPGPLSGSSGAH